MSGQFRLRQGSDPHCVGCAWLHFIDLVVPGLVPDEENANDILHELYFWAGSEGVSVERIASCFKQAGFLETYKAVDPTEVLQLLEDGQPVVLGSDWFEGLEHPDEHGHVGIAGEKTEHGHAVVLTERRGECVRVKNSRGSDWGDDGHAWLSIDGLCELANLGAELFTATPPEIPALQGV